MVSEHFHSEVCDSEITLILTDCTLYVKGNIKQVIWGEGTVIKMPRTLTKFNFSPLLLFTSGHNARTQQNSFSAPGIHCYPSSTHLATSIHCNYSFVMIHRCTFYSVRRHLPSKIFK